MSEPRQQLVQHLRDEADLCRNEGADDIAELLDEAAAALATPDQSDTIARLTADNEALPDRPDADLIEILGRPNFACIGIAKLLRKAGWEIKSRAEDEQAAVVLFTLKHWMADKANWAENAERELAAIAGERT